MREKISLALVFVGFILLFGIAGADDMRTMQGIYTPILPLILKSLIPLGMLGIGAVMARPKENNNE